MVEKIGGVLFRLRSWTPVPIFLALLLLRWKEFEFDAVTWTVWPTTIILGEALRLWAVRHIGRSARTRGRKCRVLVTTGPYSVVRNPLYIGNFLIFIGAAGLSELLWAVPVCAALFAIQYHCIVRWEERILQERFHDEVAAYFRDVPRWIPELHRVRAAVVGNISPRFPWPEVFRRERRTLQFVVVVLLLFAAKEFIIDHESISLPTAVDHFQRVIQ